MLGQDARGYTAYSQPGGVDTAYFMTMHDTAALSHGGPQHHHHQHQPPLYHHNENALEHMMNNSYQNYMHEPAILSEQSAPAAEPWDPQLFDSGLHLKLQNLPILDNLATQILDILSNNNLHEVIEATSQPESGAGQGFSATFGLFDQYKKNYSREQLFLNPQELNLDPSSHGTIRKANLASFAVAIFSGRDVPFPQLHDHCLDVFLPERRGLTKSVASLFLELKTQAYIAALQSGVASQKELLEYFPTDMQTQLARRRPGSPTLSPVEQDLCLKVTMRRNQLLQEQYNSPQLRPMYNTWKWVDLLKVLNQCIREQVRPTAATPSLSQQDYSAMLFPQGSQGSIHDVQTTPPQESGPFPGYQEQSPVPQRTLSNKSLSHSASGRNRSVSNPSKIEKTPIHIQYEKARSATTTKSTPPSRRVSVASQRKPWSQDEEKALMDGLDRVKGPHWSQILALYGVGGRISEVLKERTQVQLKDKARNLKLFFLKSGIEVPTYLQGVTGELKTRAPAQAAKREREERLKMERDGGEGHARRPP